MQLHSLPLRERSNEELDNLIFYYLNKTSEGKIKYISQSSLDILRAYSWPGNIRELNSVIEVSVGLIADKSKTVFEKSDLVFSSVLLEPSKIENKGQNTLEFVKEWPDNSVKQIKFFYRVQGLLAEGKTKKQIAPELGLQYRHFLEKYNMAKKMNKYLIAKQKKGVSCK